VRRVDELQDIDELCVVDGGAGGGGGAASAGLAAAAGGGAAAAAASAAAAAAAGLANGGAQAAQAAQAATGLLAGALSGALSGGMAGMAGVGGAGSDYEADDGEAKYVRRQGAARRTLQTLFPTLFQAGSGSLPVSLRDGGGLAGAGSGVGGLPPMGRVRSARARAGSAGGAGMAVRPSRRRRALRFLVLLAGAVCCVAALVFFFARSHPDSDLPEGVRAFEREVARDAEIARDAVARAEEAVVEEVRRVSARGA
jgi:hypothetical protein